MEQASEEMFDRAGFGYSIYDWDLLLDGTPWKLRQHTDFTVAAESFINYARVVAKNRNLRLRVRNRNKEDFICIQAVPVDAEDWSSAATSTKHRKKTLSK